MYKAMDRSMVQSLCKRGLSYREIAEQLQGDKKTVMRILRSPVDVEYQRKSSGSQVDAFKEQIERWLKDKVPIERMLELVRDDDPPYPGSRSVFFKQVKKMREEFKLKQAERFVRFEGMPGEYLQIDWGEVRNFPFLREEGATRYFFAARLKFSRKAFVVFTRDMKLETLVRCILQAFEAFGGVSWVGVFDNMKTVTTGRDSENRPIWNKTFFQFCQDLDFHPEACAPASGNQKGAVENLVGWVKSNFLPGRKFLDDADLATQNTAWLKDKANGSVSQAHGEVPDDVFLAEERHKLTPLSTSVTEYGLFSTVQSGPQSLIHIDSNRYSIPVGYAETPLTARLRLDAIDFYSDDKLVAHWVRHHGKRFRPFINPEHFEPVFDKKPRARVMLYRDHLVEQDLSVAAYIAELCRRRRGAFGPDIVALYGYWKEYGTEELGVACALASEHGAYGSEYVLSLLLRPQAQPIHDLVTVAGALLQQELDCDLSEYESFVYREDLTMDNEQIEVLLRKLKLGRMREVLKDSIEHASRDGVSFGDFLGRLLEEEVAARAERRITRLIHQADFPFIATLEQFDFRLRPELRRQVFQSYLDPSFVRDGRALVMIGRPGLGKTHLAISVGVHFAQRGFDARCVVVQTLVNRVLGAEGIRGRERVLRPYAKCDVLILDELGYLAPVEGTGPLLYELIAQRYERRATIITTNKSLTEWGRVLSDTALASALIDRLMHHGDVYHLKGPSYRLRDKAALGLDNDGTEQPAPSDTATERTVTPKLAKHNGTGD